MNEIVNKYYVDNYDLLIKRMNRRLGSMEDAEDVVQEAFARALKYYPSRTGNRFENWFSVILNNVYRKFLNDSKMGGLSKSFDDSVDEIEPVIIDHFKSLTKSELKRLINSKENNAKQVIRLNITFGYEPAEIKLLTGFGIKYIYNTIQTFSEELRKLYV